MTTIPTVTEGTLSSDTESVISNAMQIASQSTGLTVSNDEEYAECGEHVVAIKSRIKELNDERLEITRPMDDAKKKVMALFARPIDALKAAETGISRTMLTYSREQERKRREAEEKARKAQEEEQKRLDRLAKQRAARAMAKGDEEKAAMELATAPIAEAPVVDIPAPPPKVKGMRINKTYKCEVTDPMALIKAVAAGHVAPHVVIPDESALNKMAAALKEGFHLPGCKLVKSQSTARTGR